MSFGWVKRNWPFLIGPAVAALASLICWFVNTGLFLVMPGDAVDTSKMVSVPSAPAKNRSGQLLLMTVYSMPANADEWIFGHVYPHARLVPANTQLPPNTSYERFQHLEEAMMQDSQTTAKVVALRQLGYTVAARGQGAAVDAVQPGSAADRAGIKKGDLIVAVNGQAVETADQLMQVISAFPPGTGVIVRLKPNNSDAERDLSVTLGTRSDQPGKALLGVTPITYRPTFDFPVQVGIDSKGIIGPSAGLVLTLSIMQALSPSDITHGHNIAATGTIDLQGNVGPIGDVADKVIAAEGHGEYFLVPKADVQAAKQTASRIQVIETDTLQQATDFLQGLH